MADDAVTAFRKLKFQDMVDDVAGRALLKLVKGVEWQSIFYAAALEISQWQANQKKS